MKVLFYGLGNPCRGDDGLGPAFIDRLRNENPPQNWSFQVNYQLNAEDALLISSFDKVIFVDASHRDSGNKPFILSEIEPLLDFSYSTHAMTPESILGLCSELYNKKPQCYLLEIIGDEWGIQDSMSPTAETNLSQALRQNLPVLIEGYC